MSIELITYHEASEEIGKVLTKLENMSITTLVKKMDLGRVSELKDWNNFAEYKYKLILWNSSHFQLCCSWPNKASIYKRVLSPFWYKKLSKFHLSARISIPLGINHHWEEKILHSVSFRRTAWAHPSMKIEYNVLVSFPHHGFSCILFSLELTNVCENCQNIVKRG